MLMRSVCVVSSGRADYGLLYWPMKLIQQDPDLELQTVVTGMHLSPAFGMSVHLFEQDGFPVSKRVDMLLADDSAVAVTKSLGLAVIGFADAFEALRPDIVVLLGDRYEVLAAAQAALIAKIPVAHLFGGDTTEGAFDESIRHSITKMSHLHFVSNAVSQQRVLQLGENPKHVYNVGATSLDAIKRATFLNREAFFASIGFIPRKYNLLVTFHPVTLGRIDSVEQFSALLKALDQLGSDYGLIFTRPNADSEGRKLNGLLDAYVEHHNTASCFTSLGANYLNALKHIDVVVGNSSSGIYEAPSFAIPTVNIGDRQKGRLQADSIVNCKPESEAILTAITNVVGQRFEGQENPYGDGNSSIRIVEQLKAVSDPQQLLQKHFFMDGEHHE